MNWFLALFVKVFSAINTMVIVWLLSFFAFDQSFLLSSGFAAGGAVIGYTMTAMLWNYRMLRKYKLTRSEFKYIKKNLNEAKPKIYRLQKSLFSIRDIPTLKQRMELTKITRKIYSMTKKEPRRFFQAERFYFSHLDSAVELTEKYAFLSGQPKKNWEIQDSLSETRRTLKELTEYIEEDLYHMISDDVDQLKFELDVAKHSIKTLKDSKLETKAGDYNER
ncbi:5-bromo-4-chloroindolyl phosphate hydrolysis family protein [Fictibacillus sp. KIGAM418]|uniref:5-bromo-4-chloroindolyl phosphate hydrolysis family protein n=1 Tax=Fictibacillus marinisediminis TaxID=2878389 RepID=A0A9X1XA31_9BACL|nr:5-bromo-4-chloroindolyl phosphate hydrolysis family protein [Fictibacillus marinisediminis]MCK6255563.1 5-bromo-4-chloroindolyl phosphate hydrolysis family protein [Fictibacillus marinisediminis]